MSELRLTCNFDLMICVFVCLDFVARRGGDACAAFGHSRGSSANGRFVLTVEILYFCLVSCFCGLFSAVERIWRWLMYNFGFD